MWPLKMHIEKKLIYVILVDVSKIGDVWTSCWLRVRVCRYVFTNTREGSYISFGKILNRLIIIIIIKIHLKQHHVPIKIFLKQSARCELIYLSFLKPKINSVHIYICYEITTHAYTSSTYRGMKCILRIHNLRAHHTMLSTVCSLLYLHEVEGCMSMRL